MCTICSGVNLLVRIVPSPSPVEGPRGGSLRETGRLRKVGQDQCSQCRDALSELPRAREEVCQMDAELLRFARAEARLERLERAGGFAEQYPRLSWLAAPREHLGLIDIARRLRERRKECAAYRSRGGPASHPPR